jgi:dipeptidyl-peptidase-4
MWWSPDSQTLAYYEVREEGMQDYYLTGGNLDSYTTVLASRYPKAGDSNPEVFLWLYDLASGIQRKIDIPGEPRQYLYRIQFSPDGKELLVHRTNRRQDVLDWIAIDLVTLEQRVVVSEKQPTWQENAPTIRFLEDGQRFLWETESNGWKRYHLRHLDGRLLAELTPDVTYPCGELVQLDEAAGWLYYTAFSDSNPYAAQLHRVRLDGTQAQRTIAMSSPCGKWSTPRPALWSMASIWGNGCWRKVLPRRHERLACCRPSGSPFAPPTVPPCFTVSFKSRLISTPVESTLW